MPISCETQIDCHQGNITMASFFISNHLLHVISVCVCIFSHFKELISLPSPLLPSAENLLAAPGKSGAWPAAFPCRAWHRAGCTLKGLAISNPFTLMQDEGISELRRATEVWIPAEQSFSVSDPWTSHYLPRHLEPSDLPFDSSHQA